MSIEIQSEIEERLSKFPDRSSRVLQDGFLELEDSWGDETTIVNTARLSVSNRRVEKVEDMSQRDIDLLHHLLKNNHGTPFETVYFRFRIVAPIFVMRQWVKHRISTWNEFSMRYRKPIDLFYIPSKEALEYHDTLLMSDSQTVEYIDLMNQVFRFYHDQYEASKKEIDERLEWSEDERKMARARLREVLRCALPVSSYSDVFWTVNFRSLMNFFDLRAKEGAQYEMRQYALEAMRLTEKRLPLLMKIYHEVKG